MEVKIVYFINQTKISCATVFIAFLIITLLLFCGSATASSVSIVSGDVKEGAEYSPGDLISFTMVVSDIPAQTQTICISTGLQPVNSDDYLWHLNSDSVKVASSSLRSGVIELTAPNGFPGSFEVKVTGKAPILITEKTIGRISIKEMENQRKYNYYEVRSLDKYEHELDNPQAVSFNVVVMDEKEFKSRAGSLSDNSVSSKLIEMYEKGLQDDAWRLLERLEMVKQPDIPIIVPIIAGIAGLVIGGIVGWIFGYRKGKMNKPWSTTSEDF